MNGLSEGSVRPRSAARPCRPLQTPHRPALRPHAAAARPPAAAGARGQGAVTARRRGRRCHQLRCHPAPEETRAPSATRGLHHPSRSLPPLPAPRGPPPRPPLPHTTVRASRGPGPPPPPFRLPELSGRRRRPSLTCHVPNLTTEGGASRPREGRGQRFRADKGRRHVRAGRNRPRRLPGCNFRRMRSARASCATTSGRMRLGSQKFFVSVLLELSRFKLFSWFSL